jgi:autotransporter-associated beta strand protein
MLKLPYGTLAFDSGARPGVTAFDVSIPSTGNKPIVEARAALDGARASIRDLAMWNSTVNFGVPASATTRTGLRVTGATTFASGAVFNVTAPAAATAADAGGAFLALDGPVTASKPGVPLIKSGPGSLGLFNPANAFTGLTVNGGLIVFDSAAALGDPAATINLSGGGLRYAGAGAATIGQTVAVGAAGATLDAYGQGSLTVAGPLTGGGGTAGLAKVGPGTVVFGAANSPYTGPLDVRAGTLRISGSVPNSKGVTVAAGATFEAAATQSVAALTVNGGGAARVAPGGHNVLSVRALDLAVANPTTGAGGASLDLSDGGLIFDHDGGAAALAYVRDRVRSAFAGGTWTGSGITSSTAASDGRRGVGFAEARDVVSLVGGVGRFMGAAVDDTAIVVRATVLGDATLDGVVNFDDLLALAKHYNASGDAAVWSAGDFTYDAAVNFDDLLVLAKNYNATLPAADLAVAGAPAAFPALMAAAFEAAVPVPSGGVLAMAAACTAMTSRRRRRAGRPG